MRSILKHLLFVLSLLALALGHIGFDEKTTVAPINIVKDSGRGYSIELAPLDTFFWRSTVGDTEGQEISNLKLFESGQELGPPHSPHDIVRNSGSGAFSHWHSIVLFSTTDNSDPRTNGKIYQLIQSRFFSPNGTIIVAILTVLTGLLCWRTLRRVFLWFMPFSNPMRHLTAMTAVGICALYLFIIGLPTHMDIQPGQIEQESTYGFRVKMPEPMFKLFEYISDAEEDKTASALLLTENGSELGPPHSLHEAIRNFGEGRFSHWNGQLIFSSSDHSDPRTNGKLYAYSTYQFLKPAYIGIVAGLWLLSLLFAASISGNLRRTSVALALLVSSSIIFPYTSAVLLWIVLGVVLISAVHFIFEALRVFSVGSHEKHFDHLATNLTIMLASVFMSLAGVESYFYLKQNSISLTSWVPRQTSSQTNSSVSNDDSERASYKSLSIKNNSASVSTDARIKPLTDEVNLIPGSPYDFWIDPLALKKIEERRPVTHLPQQWEKRDVSIPGASRAFYWLGTLHTVSADNFRRDTPFLKKDPNKLRIMVVGDSLTYGLGVALEHTYPSVLQTLLTHHGFNVEVLNLGVMGYQSEDVLHVIDKFLPILMPDLVIYGACLNDLLESGRGQQQRIRIPIPRFIESHTSVGTQLQKAFQFAAIDLGYAKDFYADIIEKLDVRGPRFLRDVKAMNAEVTKAGLPTMVSMVFQQFPVLEGDAYKLQLHMEDLLDQAGTDRISTDEYIRKYAKQDLNIGFYEIHPNELAYAIFADMIYKHIKEYPILMKYHQKIASPL